MATQAEIKQYLSQFGGNYTPDVMAQIGAAAQQYGVSPQELAQASGYSADQVNTALLTAQRPATQITPATQTGMLSAPVVQTTPSAPLAPTDNADFNQWRSTLPQAQQQLMMDYGVAAAAKQRLDEAMNSGGSASRAVAQRQWGPLAANLPSLTQQMQSTGLLDQFNTYGRRTGFMEAFNREITPMLLAAAAAYGGATLMNGGTGMLGGTGTGTGAGGAAGAIVPEGGTLLADGTILDAAGTVIYTPQIASGGGMLMADGSIMGAGGTVLNAGAGAIPSITGSGIPSTPTLPGVATSTGGAAAAPVSAGGGAGTGLLGGAVSSINSALGTNLTGGGLLSTGLGALGSYLQGSSAQDAAQIAANAQIEAARIAADAARFRPVGVTTRFGQSNFGYDANGNLISAGYTPSADIRAQQDTLMGISNQALNQVNQAGAVTAPMGATAQTLFGLGQGYLSTTPQQQAAQYMQEQQALLAAPRADQLAALQNKLAQQGRLGLAVGGNAGMLATNPEMAAYYNSLQQQDLSLAAQATQGGMDYARFGAGLVGTGGDMLNSMYGTQAASIAPYQSALGGATTLENLAQQPMDIGTSIGARSSTAAANAGMLTAQGMTNAAQTMQPANAYSPWGSLLTGAGQAMQQYRFDPMTGRAL